MMLFKKSRTDPVHQPTSAHIDIWVIGGGVKLKSTGSVFGTHAAGFHFGGDGVGKILINGDSSSYKGSGDEKADLILHVFAHEIGHVMIGEGHAEDGTSHAVLGWGNDLSKSVDRRDKLRLMCSGKNADQKNPPKQIIKAEWDFIEAWIKMKEANNNLF